eukprot:6214003-Pleurochrysis_carterae.AAC.1
MAVSVFLSHRLDTAAPSNNRRGRVVLPTTIIRLKFLRRALPLILQLAIEATTNGRTSNESTRPATPRANGYTVRAEAESTLDQGAVMRYESSQQEPRRKGATAHKRQCQNMQRRMNATFNLGI